MEPDYDLLIIGGGINGVGIARDAAGRGMRVLLVESGDLAGATSSASSKMIHGGLRYLEYFEFRLVREALREREVLLGLAPHIIWPLDFVLPHVSGVRPAWMVRMGLWLYDHLGRRKKLKASSGVDLVNHTYGAPLADRYKTGFSYADCWVDDARLVVLNAVDARELGAHVVTRTACTGLTPENAGWRAELRDSNTGQTHSIHAHMVVNAAGPWVHDILESNHLTHAGKTPKTRLIKGSHIIVPKIHEGAQAYMLQQPDRRVVFAFPYQDDFTLIGTTDVEFKGDATRPVIDAAETQYLCDAANLFFRNQIQPGDVVSSYSGVRPLMDDGRGNASKVTRDYHLEFDPAFGAPLLSIFGGKVTTYRRLAEDAVNMLVSHWRGAGDSPVSLGPWTHTLPLPGGDILDMDFDGFVADQTARYSFLPPALVRRYARLYGTRMDRFLGGAHDRDSMGQYFGDDVYQAEIDYLITTEWARTAEDILWRRTKLGLHTDAPTRARLGAYIKSIVDGGE